MAHLAEKMTCRAGFTKAIAFCSKSNSAARANAHRSGPARVCTFGAVFLIFAHVPAIRFCSIQFHVILYASKYWKEAVVWPAMHYRWTKE